MNFDWKKFFLKKHVKQSNSEMQRAFSRIQDQVRLAIGKSNLKQYKKLSNKLLNDTVTDKCYWIFLKKHFKQLKDSLHSSFDTRKQFCY